MSNITEQDFQRALHSVVDDWGAPPVERIVSGALIEGRRLRRRRTLHIVPAVGVLAGVVAAGAALVGTSASRTVGDSALDPAAKSAETQAPVTHQFGVSADWTAQTLAGLLPAGATTHLANHDGSVLPKVPQHTLKVAGGAVLKSITSAATAPYRGGQLDYDDGHGAALVEITIQAPDHGGKPSPDNLDIGSALCHQPEISCSVVQGGTLVTESDVPEYAPSSPSENAASNQVDASTAIYESDGWAITVTAYNATQEKGGAVTRATPPLTATQLARIATYTGWLQ
ncbi:MAG: hypothetical protein ACRDP1_10585 [Nocardioidaceae bacterium]